MMAVQVFAVVDHAPGTPLTMFLVCVIEPEYPEAQLKNCVSTLMTGGGAVYPEQKFCCHAVEYAPGWQAQQSELAVQTYVLEYAPVPK